MTLLVVSLITLMCGVIGDFSAPRLTCHLSVALDAPSFVYYLNLFRRSNSSSKWAVSSPSWGWWVWKWPPGGDGVSGTQKRESCLKAEITPCSVAKQNLCSQLLKVTISFCFPTSLRLHRAWNCKGSSEAQPRCGSPDLIAKARARTYCVICELLFLLSLWTVCRAGEFVIPYSGWFLQWKAVEVQLQTLCCRVSCLSSGTNGKPPTGSASL